MITDRSLPAAVQAAARADRAMPMRATALSTPGMVGRRLPRGRRSQSGVGLIEVLIAVLVLSIAFLGIAALQAMSLSTSNSSMARSMATIASYSILDAMRADVVNARAGTYNTAAPITADVCPAAGATLQTWQVNQWCQQLAQISGKVATTTGAISCPASGDCTITVSFDDSRAGVGGSSTQQIITKGTP